MVVVVSPLVRALETAVEAFGGGVYEGTKQVPTTVNTCTVESVVLESRGHTAFKSPGGTVGMAACLKRDLVQFERMS